MNILVESNEHQNGEFIKSLDIVSNLAHTDPPAARVVKSSSKQSPSFPDSVRVPRFNGSPPEMTSNSNNLFVYGYYHIIRP